MIAIVTANAPFGQALMGKEVGDEIEFRVADKQFCYGSSIDWLNDRLININVFLTKKHKLAV